MKKIRLVVAVIAVFTLGLVGTAALTSNELTFCSEGPVAANHYLMAFTGPEGGFDTPEEVVNHEAARLGLADAERVDLAPGIEGVGLRADGKGVAELHIGRNQFGRHYLSSVVVCLDTPKGRAALDILDEEPMEEPTTEGSEG